MKKNYPELKKPMHQRTNMRVHLKFTTALEMQVAEDIRKTYLNPII